MKKSFLLLIFNLLFTSVVFGQAAPVKWDVSMKGNQTIVFKATIEAGYHIYSLDATNPSPTNFRFEQLNQVSLKGDLTPSRAADMKEDEFFGTIGEYSGTIEFRQSVNIENPNDYTIAGVINYQACNDQACQQFTYPFSLSKKVAVTAEAPKEAPSKQPDAEVKAPAVEELVGSKEDTTTIAEEENDTLQSVIDTPVQSEEEQPAETEHKERSLWVIFISGFVGGLLALLTPCVWPMIPMTVSFFLKKKQSRRKAIFDAVIYGLSIIVIYLGLGLLITIIFGASALNQLATSAVFNILFFLLLVVFAISFFGAFDITLPASWSNKLDRKADSATGILAIFFMAFTLALVSFSCTGPIIGTLLVETASGGMLAPAIGMGGFAIALAIPFALFATFPSLMKQMPKSGGWLNSVKVVLGFLELALALKFLSVADLAYGWRILDREVFLVLWIVIFALLGFYLLGKITFSHDSKLEYVSVTRLFLAIISFAFALYMVPGLWGAPCKAISAFAPPITTQDFVLSSGDGTISNSHNDNTKAPVFNDYDKALEYAQKTNKPLLVDFSGHGCVNCRKMEAKVLADKEIHQMIETQFVFVTLMVDERKKLEEPITVTENEKEITLKTIGDKWSFLQRSKFGRNAQPYYVIVDNEGNLLSDFDGYDENIGKFKAFLEKGLAGFENE